MLCPSCRFLNPETATTACFACLEPFPRGIQPRTTRFHRDVAVDPNPTPAPAGGMSVAEFLAQLQAMSRGDAAYKPAPVASPPRSDGSDTTRRWVASPPATAPSRPTQRLTPLAAPPPEPVQPPVSQLPRIPDDDPRIVAWLCCDPFPPVPVGAEPVVTLGRAATSGLVLPHPGVSRTHAVVRVAGRDLVFEDRSSYGSYVNGERVLTRPLAVGDVLIVGPYEIKVRSTAEVQGKSGPAEQTRPIETFRNLPSAEAMSGRIEKASLLEVLQAIEFNRKTGTLEVFTEEDRKGQLVIYEGAPMCASFGHLKGSEAVFAMVALRRGHFSFRSKIEAGERTISTTLTGLLLEAGRRMDEGVARSS